MQQDPKVARIVAKMVVHNLNRKLNNGEMLTDAEEMVLETWSKWLKEGGELPVGLDI